MIGQNKLIGDCQNKLFCDWSCIAGPGPEKIHVWSCVSINLGPEKGQNVFVGSALWVCVSPQYIERYFYSILDCKCICHYRSSQRRNPHIFSHLEPHKYMVIILTSSKCTLLTPRFCYSYHTRTTTNCFYKYFYYICYYWLKLFPVLPVFRWILGYTRLAAHDSTQKSEFYSVPTSQRSARYIEPITYHVIVAPVNTS